MGKIVMPKNSALLNEIEAVLQIYYEADGWLSNEKYKEKLKSIIGDDQYSSSYTKKAQITSYFGFTVWQDIHNPQSLRKITESGKIMYEALRSNNIETVQEVLMTALETVKFGRENYGCPDSDSDVEPPALFIRSVLDLGYLTYKEFAYLLWKLEDIGANYTDTLSEIRKQRIHGQVEIGVEAEKYKDAKPIMILVRWGFLAEDNEATGSKHIVIDKTVKQKYENRLRNLKIYNIDMNTDFSFTDSIDQITEFDKSLRLSGGENILLYGVPGSGKSWTIEHKYCYPGSSVERLVFHPDYTNADFIGQILPTVDVNKQIIYKFVPGPFTIILKNAYTHPMQKFFLIIEELNRGNAPAIFGEVFQLLDRIDKAKKITNEVTLLSGTSEYGISHSEMAKYIYGNSQHKIRIPSNMTILGTMNTSDQNVFTLDTAFKRRWHMVCVPNNFEKCKFKDTLIDGTNITWRVFATTINETIKFKLHDSLTGEDKRLGAYFVTEAQLKDKNKFSEKVLAYLWDDVFKYEQETIFDSGIQTLEELILMFEKNGIDVFTSQIQQEMKTRMNDVIL